MGDPQPLLLNDSEPTHFQQNARLPRVASVDVFRGLSVFVSSPVNACSQFFKETKDLLSTYNMKKEKIMNIYRFLFILHKLNTHSPFEFDHS